MESRRTARQVGSTSSSSRRKRTQAAIAAGADRDTGRLSRRSRPAPKKSLGQHFLTDRNIIRRIVDGAELTGSEPVLEVGPGPGDLTSELAGRAARVIAVELDVGMVEGLKRRLAGATNVEVMQGDALEVKPGRLFGTEAYVVVANLPYNAGTAIVRRLLESDLPPRRLVVMLQKEVADSMLASPGAMGLAAIGVQVYATGRKLFEVAPGSFFPPPRVRSAVVRLDVRERPLVPAEDRARFFEVARAGFSAPRKQLRNALANGLKVPAPDAERAIRAAGLNPASRPQELSIDEWLRLKRSLDAFAD